MEDFSGADLIADALAQMEVEHVFAIVSIHNMPILDAINRLGKTKIVDVRHEQAGTHAADGYARQRQAGCHDRFNRTGHIQHRDRFVRSPVRFLPRFGDHRSGGNSFLR